MVFEGDLGKARRRDILMGMCGKFTQMASWREVRAFSQPLIDGDSVVVATPMRYANIIRLNDAGEREDVSMRWGFAGKGDANPSRPKHMHARSETIDRLPTFANSFVHGRGILIVHTSNEGEELPNGKTKQWVITPKEPVAVAVICEKWTNGADALDTFIQVTTPANALISKITDRMPAILPQEDWATWLGETDTSLVDVKSVLRIYEDHGSWTMTEQAPSRKTKPQEPTLF
jgi:putative SOS response-associated peptidase YedK